MVLAADDHEPLDGEPDVERVLIALLVLDDEDDAAALGVSHDARLARGVPRVRHVFESAGECAVVHVS